MHILLTTLAMSLLYTKLVTKESQVASFTSEHSCDVPFFMVASSSSGTALNLGRNVSVRMPSASDAASLLVALLTAAEPLFSSPSATLSEASVMQLSDSTSAQTSQHQGTIQLDCATLKKNLRQYNPGA